MEQISVIKPISLAIERVRQVLFSPFDLGKWLTIGFCAWLAGLGARCHYAGASCAAIFRVSMPSFAGTRRWHLGNQALRLIAQMLADSAVMRDSRPRVSTHRAIPA